MDADLILSLSPYEVAVLAFTSPNDMKDAEGVVLISTKDAYMWAGAVAHILIRNPNESIERLVGNVETAIRNYTNSPAYKSSLFGEHLGQNNYFDSGLPLLQSFLAQYDLEEEFDQVVKRTFEAMNSLEYRGLIVDPINKKIGAALLSVVMLVPVNFTHTTEEGMRINAMTWEYSQSVGEQDHRQYEFRIKVREASNAVLKKIVPSFMSAIDTLMGEKAESAPDMREIQTKLRILGLYEGDIDGQFGPLTNKALRQFQASNYMDVTGYPDDSTLRALGFK